MLWVSHGRRFRLTKPCMFFLSIIHKHSANLSGLTFKLHQGSYINLQTLVLHQKRGWKHLLKTLIVVLAYNTVKSRSTDWRSEQLLATERSRDLVEAFPYSDQFLPINNDVQNSWDRPAGLLPRLGLAEALGLRVMVYMVHTNSVPRFKNV